MHSDLPRAVNVLHGFVSIYPGRMAFLRPEFVSLSADPTNHRRGVGSEIHARLLDLAETDPDRDRTKRRRGTNLSPASVHKQ